LDADKERLSRYAEESDEQARKLDEASDPQRCRDLCERLAGEASLSRAIRSAVGAPRPHFSIRSEAAI
jgi:hypothetical protein